MGRITERRPAGGGRSWLARPGLLPLAGAALLVGNALDLIGTRLAQPNFENEANWVYQGLKAQGIAARWPVVIVAKFSVAVLFLLGLRLFLRYRRRYYPPAGTNF